MLAIRASNHGDGSVSNPLTALVENALEFFQLVLIRDVLLDDAHVGDVNAAVGKVEGVRLGLLDVAFEVLADVEFQQRGVVAGLQRSGCCPAQPRPGWSRRRCRRLVQTAGLQATKAGSAQQVQMTSQPMLLIMFCAMLCAFAVSEKPTV